MVEKISEPKNDGHIISLNIIFNIYVFVVKKNLIHALIIEDFFSFFASHRYITQAIWF